MQPRACSLGALMESETHTRILQGDTLRQTVDAESHKPAQTPLWCARHAWAHSETVSDTHLNTCAHVRAHMHTHARTHTHLPQASGTALCQVSWEGDRLQPAVAGRCPENNAPPLHHLRRHKGPLSAWRSPQGSLSTGFPGGCACVRGRAAGSSPGPPAPTHLPRDPSPSRASCLVLQTLRGLPPLAHLPSSTPVKAD